MNTLLHAVGGGDEGARVRAEEVQRRLAHLRQARQGNAHHAVEHERAGEEEDEVHGDARQRDL